MRQSLWRENVVEIKCLAQAVKLKDTATIADLRHSDEDGMNLETEAKVLHGTITEMLITLDLFNPLRIP